MSPTFCATYLFLFFVLAASAVQFEDVSISAGLQPAFGKKYGGATVADLDGDGFQDLIFGHHDSMRPEIYFNEGDGTFRRARWPYLNDIHGFVPFHISPFDNTMHFFCSVGGNFGKNPRPPVLFRVSNGRRVSRVGKAAELDFARGRGRTTIVMNLRSSPSKANDVIITNAKPLNQSQKVKTFAATVRTTGQISKRYVEQFLDFQNIHGLPVDVDMDGKMEFLSFQDVRIYKVAGWFRLQEITRAVLPRFKKFSVAAVIEFDFDNDGLMDLYIARSVTNDLHWMRGRAGPNPDDFLLRNVGGRYIDVTRQALIPKGGESRGVTAGDFNNDGFLDLLVTQFTGPDRLLVNNGDGTFQQVELNYFKDPDTRGDQPVAVDYDQNGAIDVILSEGHYFDVNFGGTFRVMKNIFETNNTWLLVRVGRSTKEPVSSLHALVTVDTGRMKMIRRIGSPGVATGSSYIETVHFGLGSETQVLEVTVRWTDGEIETRQNITANQLLKFGLV